MPSSLAALAPASRICHSHRAGLHPRRRQRPLLHTHRRRTSSNRLESEARAGRQGRLADYLDPLDFVVLDELGYLPFAQTGGQLLFHLISRLYERNFPSSSPPTWPSANGPACSASRRAHDASFFERVVRRTCVLNSTICVFERLIAKAFLW